MFSRRSFIGRVVASVAAALASSKVKLDLLNEEDLYNGTGRGVYLTGQSNAFGYFIEEQSGVNSRYLPDWERLFYGSAETRLDRPGWEAYVAREKEILEELELKRLEDTNWIILNFP